MWRRVEEHISIFCLSSSLCLHLCGKPPRGNLCWVNLPLIGYKIVEKENVTVWWKDTRALLFVWCLSGCVCSSYPSLSIVWSVTSSLWISALQIFYLNRCFLWRKVYCTCVHSGCVLSCLQYPQIHFWSMGDTVKKHISTVKAMKSTGLMQEPLVPADLLWRCI